MLNEENVEFNQSMPVTATYQSINQSVSQYINVRQKVYRELE